VANEVSKYGALSALRDNPVKPTPKPATESRPSKSASHTRNRPSAEAPTPKDEVEESGGGGLSLPSRKLTGKRSSADYRQKSVLLRITSIDAAEAQLRKKHKGTDFSELMQALLEKWLAEPS